MIYLDTHAVVWLYAGLTEKFTPAGQSLINKNDLLISPIIRLELQYLHEIGRVKESADAIQNDLSNRIGLQICNKSFNEVIRHAVTFSWTRDPFDRIIVATAKMNDSVLLTRDQHISNNYELAQW